MCYTWLYLVTLSWTFEVITCIGVPAFKYRFPTAMWFRSNCTVSNIPSFPDSVFASE